MQENGFESRGDLLYRIAETLLIAAIFFGLGIWYAERGVSDRGPLVVIEPSGSLAATPIDLDRLRENGEGNAAEKARYVASKQGKAYYLTSCTNRIKEENKVYFKTREDAERAGYAPAKTCFQ